MILDLSFGSKLVQITTECVYVNIGEGKKNNAARDIYGPRQVYTDNNSGKHLESPMVGPITDPRLWCRRTLEEGGGEQRGSHCRWPSPFRSWPRLPFVCLG